MSRQPEPPARKAARIFSGLPDIAVIQECSERSADMFGADGYAARWIGDIGMHWDWATESDHCPLTAELSPPEQIQ